VLYWTVVQGLGEGVEQMGLASGGVRSGDGEVVTEQVIDGCFHM